ncbi:hypothetical protein MTBBW1_80084 [Desulfamplus magnetovallimortis]|uniref:Uncharacterized protein n=1 Tax=Desulfamplus magnetovallimortis TaxID=1246637 RepID=L0R589_9BACT|nr:hypothetical protein [Desulfamplus magnetovallimortis]CCO06695.1 hypothetical protein DEMABW1_80084 [Desulfamplus magnetovallimortis BW-1]SLM32746.1 hypothetical protein MTBBW1_80084 [Desulfamplus magnetovallimortis]
MHVDTFKITREQVISLAKTMPVEKLTSWYEYGLFLQFRNISLDRGDENNKDSLVKELSEWEAATDDDFLKFEHMLKDSF